MREMTAIECEHSNTPSSTTLTYIISIYFVSVSYIFICLDELPKQNGAERTEHVCKLARGSICEAIKEFPLVQDKHLLLPFSLQSSLVVRVVGDHTAYLSVNTRKE